MSSVLAGMGDLERRLTRVANGCRQIKSSDGVEEASVEGSKDKFIGIKRELVVAMRMLKDALQQRKKVYRDGKGGSSNPEYIKLTVRARTLLEQCRARTNALRQVLREQCAHANSTRARLGTRLSQRELDWRYDQLSVITEYTDLCSTCIKEPSKAKRKHKVYSSWRYLTLLFASQTPSRASSAIPEIPPDLSEASTDVRSARRKLFDGGEQRVSPIKRGSGEQWEVSRPSHRVGELSVGEEDAMEEWTVKMDAIDKEVDEIDVMVDRLKEIALEMGEAGNRHAELIEKIKERNDNVDGGIRSSKLRGAASRSQPALKGVPADSDSAVNRLKISMSSQALQSRFHTRGISEQMKERNEFCGQLLQLGGRRWRGFRSELSNGKVMSAFDKSALEAQQSIAQLLQKHVSFTPSVPGYRPEKVEPKPEKKRLKSAESFTDLDYELAEKREAQLERIQVYRYHRRADGASHTVRIGLLESVMKSSMSSADSRSLSPGPSIGSDIMLRNSSSEYISSMYSAESVLAQRKQQANDWRARRDLTIERLLAIEAFKESRFELALYRKARQVEELERRKMHSRAYDQILSCQRNWLGALAFASFMSFVSDEVNLIRLKSGTGGNKKNSRQGGAPRTTIAKLQYEAVLAKQQELDELMADADVQRLVPLLQAHYSLRFRIRRRRRAAAVVMACLKSWKTAGKIMLATRKFHERCRRIQRFWRAVKRRLDRIIQHCCDRWVKLERQILSKELNVAQPPAGSGNNAPSSRRASFKPQRTRRASSKCVEAVQLTLQERVQLALLPDQVRRRFVENEMRFRRFVLLPEIYAWHDAMEKYQDDVESWRQHRLAARAMQAAEGKQTRFSTGDVFRVPVRPACPTHMPTDDNLIEWFARCRKNPSAYSRIGEGSSKAAAAALKRFKTRHFILPEGPMTSIDDLRFTRLDVDAPRNAKIKVRGVNDAMEGILVPDMTSLPDP
ncbi:hypothetical protein FOL47_011152 [Perkinsus chesapeaki]|uniref:t-SNARE coiled-coil homology domain-containing protein n=1 Tax=Perkinsus chesapeaki TaxID=330153 RepID=A0A7J6MN08_PERCH|nr:hypothetical protein FOL47_011152 [Perkinsus chesapeaki]